ncbi:MAG: HAD family phosphatase [Lachnospiraceae bacterium]|nr:HAD family phosphatase [Lachnospiraceae bacterium]
MEIKGIIFDMDGLMFDTERIALMVWNQVWESEGIDPNCPKLGDMHGITVQEAAMRYEKAFHGKVNYYELRKKKQALMEEYIHTYGLPVKKGLYELLEYLKERKYRIAIATSTMEKEAVPYLEMAQVTAYFDGRVFGDMVERGKPDAEIFCKAAEQLGLKPEECMVLEDSWNGLRGALVGGFHAVMIPDQQKPDPQLSKKLTAICDSLLDVPHLLEK